MSTPHTCRIATTDGLKLHARVEGSAAGPTLILVHGYPDNLHVWDAVVEQLKTRYRIIRYDVRGAGRSEAPAGFTGYRLTQLRADFRRVIDQLSPDAAVHLVGHDWGSIAAWEFVTEPALAGRIASFTSISGPYLDHVGHSLHRDGLNARTLRQLAASWYIGAYHLPLLAPTIWRRGLARLWPRVLSRLERMPKPAAHATQRRDSINGIGLYRANVLPRLLRPRPRLAVAPVQLLVARQDPFVTTEVLRGIEQCAPGLARVEMDCGHWSPLSQPGLLATHIQRFVHRIDQTPSAN